MSLERSDLVAAVSRQAIVHNCRVFKHLAGKRKFFVVIKADAYGHGIDPVAAACADVVDGFCVFAVAEALALASSSGPASKPILLMGGTLAAAELAELARLRIWLAVTTPEQVAAMAASKQLFERIFLKAQTGMNRLGLQPDCLRRAYAELRPLAGSQGCALMNHFACADTPAGWQDQAAHFAALQQELQLPFTSSNSAATMIEPWPLPDEEFVRCGLGVYGCSPIPERTSAAELALRPALTLIAKVLAIQELKAGDTVSYGAAWRAQQEARIAILSCGYADGYPLSMPSGTPVLINGRRCPLAGRVCMDMLAVEVTGIPCAVGDDAVLWGQGLPAEEVAASGGTLSYELLTGLNARVRRNYID